MDKPVKTLESEIKDFADGLPYWGKFLSQKILQGTAVTDADITAAHEYLLEDLGLKEKPNRPAIALAVNPTILQRYKAALSLKGIGNVQGVNALSDAAAMEFSPNLTIVYGDNGSGKSGYTRLLKRAFYSKAPENIVPNIYSAGAPKPVSATFTFADTTTSYPSDFPTDESNVAYSQFAVFDGKSILKHLENRNQFEFRPSGLNYFASFTDGIRRLEAKVNAEAGKRSSENMFPALFDGTSEIKAIIEKLSGKTNLADIKKYVPYTEEDKKMKDAAQKTYDDFSIGTKNKEREKAGITKIKSAFETSKQHAVNLNKFFTDDHLTNTHAAIQDLLQREQMAKKEGIDSFATDSIREIGSQEWKDFILAASQFAQAQENEYPADGDVCLLCHQPLTTTSKSLIEKYWAFIKSAAEAQAKIAKDKLDKGIQTFEKLNFDLFPDGGTLTQWLTENQPAVLDSLSAQLAKLKTLSSLIVGELKVRTMNPDVKSEQLDVTAWDKIIAGLDQQLKSLSDDKEREELQRLKSELDYWLHKEKLALHYDKIEKFVENQKWLAKVGTISWGKKATTEAEKALSAKYFNQGYIDTFNDECKKMNGSFGIVINHTGAGGTSYRQLFIEGKNPASVLSDGEQNVIAIADFVTEMNMSEVNRGIIFDDPVTSLDHTRREVIAMRLVSEAGKKQVIVFTHDVVFLLALKYYAAKLAVPMSTQTLYKIGETAGHCKPNMPWVASNVKDRLGYLNAELQRITKVHRTGDPDEYRREAKVWCEYLREAWERSVEERLLKGVITRFEPGIQTQRLKNVIITPDLLNDINNGMTVTSNWIHDQGPGMNAPTPTPDELKKWADEFDEFINKKCKA